MNLRCFALLVLLLIVPVVVPAIGPAIWAQSCAPPAPVIAPGTKHVALTDAVTLVKAAIVDAQCQLKAAGTKGGMSIKAVDLDFQTVTVQDGSITAGYILTLGAEREKTVTSDTAFHYAPPPPPVGAPRVLGLGKTPAPEVVLADAIAAAGKSLAEVPSILNLTEGTAKVTLSYSIKKDGTLTLAPVFGLISPFTASVSKARRTTQAVTVTFGLVGP